MNACAQTLLKVLPMMVNVEKLTFGFAWNHRFSLSKYAEAIVQACWAGFGARLRKLEIDSSAFYFLPSAFKFFDLSPRRLSHLTMPGGGLSSGSIHFLNDNASTLESLTVFWRSDCTPMFDVWADLQGFQQLERLSLRIHLTSTASTHAAPLVDFVSRHRTLRTIDLSLRAANTVDMGKNMASDFFQDWTADPRSLTHITDLRVRFEKFSETDLKRSRWPTFFEAHKSRITNLCFVD